MATTERPATGPRANFGQRLGAALLDGVLLIIVQVLLSAILGQSAGQALGLLIGLGYYAYFEGGETGQTIGKKVLNIRVIDAETGGAIGMGRGLLRYVGRIASTIPCGLGYFWMLWDDNKQTWHDKIATTVVVPTSAYPVA